MATAVIVAYWHPPRTPRARLNGLRRALFGWTDRAGGGRYRYERRGLLSGVPHIEPRRGVLVVPARVRGDVVALVKEHGARAWARRVVLEPVEAKRFLR